MAENIPIRPHRKSVPSAASQAKPRAPSHLSPASKKFFDVITSEWILGPDGLEILTCALESRDAYKECRQQVARDGPTFVTKSGRIAANPACKLANDYLREFRLGLKQLGLDPEKGQ